MSITAPLTLERHLAAFQEIDPIYEHLYAAWKIAKADLPRILRNIAKIFPHYSLHDESHSEAIIRQIEAVLGEERILMIKPTETWLILMSAYTHDFGMLVQDEIMHKTWQSKEFQEYLQNIKLDSSKRELREYADWFIGNKWDKLKKVEVSKDWPLDVKWAAILLSADYFRSIHPQRGRAIINGEETCIRFDLSFNRFVHERLLSLLGDVAFLHGASFERIFELRREANGVGQYDDIVYPRRVACLLRLGDLLDMDNGRFDEDAYLLYGEVPGSTISNREKHASIKHFLVKGNRIEIGADCPTEEGFEVTSRWIAMIQRELDNLALKWNDIVPDGFGTAPSLAYKDLRLNGKPLYGDVLRHFNFSNEAIFELLEGANIYKNQFSCFRELIQNAIDASKLRLWYGIQAGVYEKQKVFATDKNLVPFKIEKEIFKEFPIEVEIKYLKIDGQEPGFYITVRDHGIGINEERLHSMEEVAKSWSANAACHKTIQDMPRWLRPTGEFGLGLQSVFQLTDTLICDTTPINDTPKHIVFRSKSNEGRISYQDIDSVIPTQPGSKFTFFIPIQCFKSYHYSWGTFFDQKIHSMDPFCFDSEYRSLLVNIYYLYQCIIDDVDSGLFPVIIRLIIDDHIVIEQEIPIRFSYTGNEKSEDNDSMFYRLNSEIDKGDILTICFEDTLQSCTAYNVNDSILYQLTLKPEFRRNQGINLLFKGMHVDGSILHRGYLRNISQVIYSTISLEGFSAKEYLTLNREKIKDEKIKELSNLINNDIVEIAKKWILKIISRTNERDNTIAKGTLLSAIILSEFLNDKSCIIPENILRQSSFSIMALKKDDSGNFIEDKMLLSDLIINLRNGDDIYIYIHDAPYIYAENTKFNNEIINELLGDWIKDINILYDWNYLKNLINLNRLYVKELILEEAQSPQNMDMVAKCSGKVDGHTHQLPKLSAHFQDLINKTIFNAPRVVLVATWKWQVLAVKEVPWSLKRTSYLHVCLRIGYEHCAYIISPFIDEDLEKINSKSNLSDVCDCIKYRDDFNRLVNYVKKHNISESITEDEVRKTYIEWINYLVNWYAASNE